MNSHLYTLYCSFCFISILPTIDRVTAILVLRLVGDLVTLTFQLWSWKVLILEILSRYAYLRNYNFVLTSSNIGHKTSVSHPFSSLNSSTGLDEGKHYPKITIVILRLVLQNFAFPGCSPYILFYQNLFSLLSSGWFVITVCCPISVRKLVK